jgi:hypothetical protein
VGWIGSGYKYAFDGVELCAGGIENHSDARRFVWTVEGWAGTHRNAVMWTGDDSGSFDYIGWQIPTFIGCGFSSQAHVSGDVDGIFGGSAETYVRDLQMKALTTTVMTMSGWAANPDKQPWSYGEPYTSINRASLQLKARMTPYLYTLSRLAHDTGVPPLRAMLLEFPADESLYANGSATALQFMVGPWLLAAPVYEAGAIRRTVRLPGNATTVWLDFWDGSVLKAGQTLDAYDAPLHTLPLFVRAGAIVPTWPPMTHFDAAPHDPMVLELWPDGATQFELYEDDGITREALSPTAAYATTPISVVAPAGYQGGGATGNVTIRVGGAAGHFKGQLGSRGWRLNVRSRSPPVEVLLLVHAMPPTVLPKLSSPAELEYRPSGWFHDRTLQPGAGGLLMIKVPSLATAAAFDVVLSTGAHWPHIHTEVCGDSGSKPSQRFAFNASSGRLVTATGACLTIGDDDDPGSHTKAVEVQPCDKTKAAKQQWARKPSGQLYSTSTQQCLDQDVSDHAVEMYGCHDESHAGNQAWKLPKNSTGGDPFGPIVSVSNGLCMAVGV